jgi:signal peptidase I
LGEPGSRNSAAPAYSDFRYGDVMRAWLKAHIRLVLPVIGGLSLVPAYVHAYALAGPSAIPTVLVGDKVIVNSAAYRLTLPYSNVTLFQTALPRRGDLVLLHVLNDPHLKLAFFKRLGPIHSVEKATAFRKHSKSPAILVADRSHVRHRIDCRAGGGAGRSSGKKRLPKENLQLAGPQDRGWAHTE